MAVNAVPRKFKILFLCTGNSARSILAEYMLRRLDPVHFETYSAGASPKGRVNPLRRRAPRRPLPHRRERRSEGAVGGSIATSRSTLSSQYATRRARAVPSGQVSRSLPTGVRRIFGRRRGAARPNKRRSSSEKTGGPNGIRTRVAASGGFGGHTRAPRSWTPAVSGHGAGGRTRKEEMARPQRDSNPCTGLRGLGGHTCPPLMEASRVDTAQEATGRREQKWRPQRESNPCTGLERAVS